MTMTQINLKPLPRDSSAETPPAYHPACAAGQQPAQTKTARQHSNHLPTPGDPDLVDRIFDYLLSDPNMARAIQAMAKTNQQPVQQIKDAVRAEFSGERCYIPSAAATDRQKKVFDVLRLFNGRNATEVARRLQISRTSVYRYIRQARQAG